MSIDEPSKGLFAASAKNTKASIDYLYGEFKVSSCKAKNQEGIQFKTGKNKFLLFQSGNFYLRQVSPNNQKTCFKIVPSPDENDEFRLMPLTKANNYIYINNNGQLGIQGKKKIGKKGYFYAVDYVKPNVLRVFAGNKFNGKNKSFKHQVKDTTDRGLPAKKLKSLNIFGYHSWQVYSKANYKGVMTVLAPGQYDSKVIVPLKIKSFRPAGFHNNLEIFSNDNFKGESDELYQSRPDVAYLNVTQLGVKSLVVVGPDSWDVFADVGYSGQKVRLAPGKYNKDQFKKKVSFRIASAKRVNPYESLCNEAPGRSKVTVRGGNKVNIDTVHMDGGVWLKFVKTGKWNYVNEKRKNLKLNLLQANQLNVLKTLELTDFMVDSDIEMVVQTQKGSYHPSKLDILRMGADEMETMRFLKKPNDATTLTFSNDHTTIRCSGTEGDTLCGDEETLFPVANEDSGPMVLLGVAFKPRGTGSFANGKWNRNAYTFKGTKYILYAKMTDCPMSSIAGTQIPDYMEHDIYTHSQTGCACEWDPSKKICACCADQGCPCGEAHRYQCVRCGYEEKSCGRPTVIGDKFEFEANDIIVGEGGDHYRIPEVCATSCTISVDALASTSTKVGAYLSDAVFNRRLACVVQTEGLNTNQSITSYPDSETGVPVDAVHLYGYDGSGFINSLSLTLNHAKCPEKTDDRVMGCFIMDTTLMEHPFSSSHMTQQKCIQYCEGLHYKFAHLFNSDYCGCTNLMLPNGLGLGCDMSCSGDSSHACGGQFDALTFQLDVSNAGGFFAAENGCAALGAVTANPRMAGKLSGSDCSKLTGKGSGNRLTNCFMEWCKSPVITENGLYVSKPGSCGSRFVSKINIRTSGFDCIILGGSPKFGGRRTGNCELDLCRADTRADSVIEAVHVGGCKADSKLGQGSLRTKGADCQAMGGSMTKFIANRVVDCTFDWCVKKFQEPLQDNIYTYPHEVIVSADTTTKLHFPSPMCVSEIEATVQNIGASGGLIVPGTVSIFYEGLHTSKDIPSGRSLLFGYTSDPTGTYTDTISVSAQGSPFTITDFKVIIDTAGCKEHDDALILYDDLLFNGRRQVIREDTSDLGEFIDRASSFKILGDSLWQLHASINYHGKSVVLSNGDYVSPEILPFGDNNLESVRRVPSRDQTRQDISNYYGRVCFERKTNHNAMYGMMDAPDGVKTFDFGLVHGDVVACEQMCRENINCAAWTITTDKSPIYPGRCFGRGFFDEVLAFQENTVSGVVADCSREDMLLVYSEPNFEGDITVIIQNEFNNTSNYRPGSIRITGKDIWILVTESASAYNKVHLAPGEYPDLSFIVDASLTMKELKKQHPSIQVYEKTSTAGLAELYPVVSNQIESIYPGTANQTCSNAQRAEVSFVTDSSASIGIDDYKTVLRFMEHIVDSFTVGVDAVRVATLLFDKYLHYDLELGQYNTLASVKAAIDNLHYYAGNTYTHKALEKTYMDILNDANCRENVARVAIVITDGASAWPEDTVIQAQKARDRGINVIAVGVNAAVYEELVAIAGDQSRVFHVDSFDQLDEIVDGITTATCTAVLQKEVMKNITEHEAIKEPEDDEKYFKTEKWEFVHKAYPLGLESGVVYDEQITAASELKIAAAYKCRLNHTGGWQAAVDASTYIEVDFGKVLPIHGLGTQGNSLTEGWVTKYKIAISLDGINFNFLKMNSTAIIFTGNTDQNTVVHHCLHKIFGEAIYARVIRIIIIEWHITVTMRFEIYGFRNPDDQGLLEVLQEDVWTRNTTGCSCYFDHSRTDCACCEDGGCQCGMTNRHQCVQCGYPHNCGTPSIRDPLTNVDGWTTSLGGCPCEYNPFLNDCACCQNYGCQCGERNKNQCVNCGHPEHCGLKEHIFGPNSYCYEKLCPKSNVEE